MRLLEIHLVTEVAPAIRLSDYLPGRLQSIPSKKGIKKAIKKGAVKIDGRLAYTGDWVQAGQTIEIYEPDTNPPLPYDIPIPVLFEDDDLAVINKPAGIPVHGQQHRTLINAIQNKLTISSKAGRLPWPLPAHRLDAPTSGLLLFAKTRTALISLNRYFANHQIQKTYQAIVDGLPPERGIIELPVDEKHARTTYQRLQSARSLQCTHISLLALFPETGRTHQLRKHLAGIGHPILGDKLYTPAERPLLKHSGLFLCATALHFIHPVDNTPVVVECPLPNKFNSILRRSEERWLKFRAEMERKRGFRG
jgi:23S rRNA pseudouridine1911/1915/1917 synthase